MLKGGDKCQQVQIQTGQMWIVTAVVIARMAVEVVVVQTLLTEHHQARKGSRFF